MVPHITLSQGPMVPHITLSQGPMVPHITLSQGPMVLCIVHHTWATHLITRHHASHAHHTDFACAPWSVRCRCSAGLSDARPLSAIGHTRNGRLVGRCDSGQAGLGLRGLREHKSGCPNQGRAKLKKVRLRRTLPKNLHGKPECTRSPGRLV